MSDFSADRLDFNESSYEIINKISDMGKFEWGVKADKSFFWKNRDDTNKHYFNITEDMTSFSPLKDFNPIVTRLKLQGSDGFMGTFTVTNRITTRELILQNSSISTQSVAQRYARAWLKKNRVAKRSYIGTLREQNKRLESTVPIGLGTVNLKIGINLKYDVATQLYDSGLKYDGGTEAFQMDKIKYRLTDTGIDTTINFGIVPSDLADELKRLDFQIVNERNIE